MVRCDNDGSRSDDESGCNTGPNHLSSISTTILGQRDTALDDPQEVQAVYDSGQRPELECRYVAQNSTVFNTHLEFASNTQL